MNALSVIQATVEPGGDWLVAVKRALPNAEITHVGKNGANNVVQIDSPDFRGFGVTVWVKELSGFVSLNSDTYRLELTAGTAATTIIKAYKAAEAIALATRDWKRAVSAQTDAINKLVEHERPFGDSFRQSLARM